MWQDPIIEEVRKARGLYAEGLGYNLKQICKNIKGQELKSKRKVISLPAKRVKPVKA
ncbi:MAG: hypothetical protein WC749_12090 [Dehalococcoidia bacterium]